MLWIYDPATQGTRRDYGTPAPVPEYSAEYATLEQVSLSIDGRQVSVPGHLGAARGRACGHQHPEALRHRCTRCLRLLPPVPGGNRRAQGLPGLLHHAGGGRHGGHDAERQAGAAAAQRDGALHLRPPARLPDLPGQRQLRAAGHGRRAVGLREVRYGYAGRNHLDAQKDTSNPYFSFDPAKCIVCSRCVRACEECRAPSR
jgi:formate dehydrogenase major subunit